MELLLHIKTICNRIDIVLYRYLLRARHTLSHCVAGFTMVTANIKPLGLHLASQIPFGVHLIVPCMRL